MTLDAPPASLPLLITKDERGLTPMMMRMAMVVRLLVDVMTSIGRTSKKMRGELDGFSLCLSFLELYAKGGEIRGVNLFSTPIVCSS